MSERMTLVMISIVACLAWLALFPLRRYLDRWQAIDVPNERSSHSRPTTRGGGLIIVIFSLVGTLFAALLSTSGNKASILVFVLAAGAVAAISWVDDLRSISSRLRFAAHSFAAILAIASFGSLKLVYLPVVGPINLGWFGAVVTFVWIVGLTNAYNFMDGIDGLAGSQAVIAGLGWAWFSVSLDQPIARAISSLLAATSLGFLGHNWSPAKVFMGDVGSAFLGYGFATLPLILGVNAPTQDIAAKLPVVAVLLVWPFVFDTTLTIIRRWRKGENIFSAHRSHLYQRLVIAGWSHQAVTLLYAGLALLGLALAYMFVTTTGLAMWLILLGLPICAGSLYMFVVQQERRVIQTKVLETYETAP